MIMLGYVHKGVVYMATDTTIVVNEGKRDRLSPNNFKIRKMKSGMIVGIVGDPNVRQRVLARDDLFALDKSGKLTKTHIVNKLIPALHRFLKDSNLYEVDKDGNYDLGINLFLAYEDKLYDIAKTLWSYRITKKTAIGEMSDLCECALKYVDPTSDIEKQLAEIMHRATTYTKYIGGPYVTINTKDQEMHITEVK